MKFVVKIEIHIFANPLLYRKHHSASENQCKEGSHSEPNCRIPWICQSKVVSTQTTISGGHKNICSTLCVTGCPVGAVFSGQCSVPATVLSHPVLPSFIHRIWPSKEIVLIARQLLRDRHKIDGNICLFVWSKRRKEIAFEVAIRCKTIFKPESRHGHPRGCRKKF